MKSNVIGVTVKEKAPPKTKYALFGLGLISLIGFVLWRGRK